MTGDPATQEWRQALGGQVRGLLGGLTPQPDGEDALDRMRGRWEACSRHREHIQRKLSETQEALAASQADLTRVEHELGEMQDDRDLWKQAAEAAQHERDELIRLLLDARQEIAALGATADCLHIESAFARAQLDDLIAARREGER